MGHDAVSGSRMMLSQNPCMRGANTGRPAIQWSSCQPPRRLVKCRAEQLSTKVVETLPGVEADARVLEDGPVAPQQASTACPVLRSLRALPPARLNRIEGLLVLWRHGLHRAFEESLGDRKITKSYFFGLVPGILMGDVETTKEFLSYESKGQVVSNWPPSTVSILGSESLVVTDANTHKFLRKLLSPALSLEAVEKYLPQIQTSVTDAMDHWVSEAEQGRTVLAVEEVKLITIRVIFSVALGREVSLQDLRVLQRDLVDWQAEILSPAPYDMWPFPFHKAMNARRRLAAFVQKEVDLVRAALNSGGSTVRPTSTLATLLTTRDEEGNRLTDKQVVDNILLLLVAGYDTTGTQLTSLLSDLAQHPEVLSKVREEQSRIISTHGHTITPAALRDMTYTQAVLSETIRKTPPVGGTFRAPTEDVGVAGYLVPKDSFTQLPYSHLIRHDPRWPADSLSPSDPLHPSRYNPDRFLTEGHRVQESPAVWGMGIHKCLGQYLAQTEAKVFLATLARGYTYTADVNTKWELIPSPRPHNGLPVVFKKLQ